MPFQGPSLCVSRFTLPTFPVSFLRYFLWHLGGRFSPYQQIFFACLLYLAVDFFSLAPPFTRAFTLLCYPARTSRKGEPSKSSNKRLSATALRCHLHHFFDQVLHLAAQGFCQHYQIFGLCFIDVLLPLFVLLNGAKRHTGLLRQFPLAESCILSKQF